MKRPLVSIIVPVYNVEKYLARCLDSLINQTFKDIEIICVNDGSPDNSLNILENYSKKDERIKIISQENKGLSAARNTGIKYANGEYIAFVDSDDWIDLNFYEKLYNAIIRTNCDIAVATIVRKKKYYKKFRVHYTEEKIFNDFIEKIDICVKNFKNWYVMNKLYKNDLVKTHLFEEGVYFEDVMWTANILKDSSNIVTVPNTNYYYFENPKSIVRSKQTQKKQQDRYNTEKNFLNFCKKNNITITKKIKTLNKKTMFILGIPILKIKECDGKETHYLFDLIPVFERSL